MFGDNANKKGRRPNARSALRQHDEMMVPQTPRQSTVGAGFHRSHGADAGPGRWSGLLRIVSRSRRRIIVPVGLLGLTLISSFLWSGCELIYPVTKKDMQGNANGGDAGTSDAGNSDDGGTGLCGWTDLGTKSVWICDTPKGGNCHNCPSGCGKCQGSNGNHICEMDETPATAPDDCICGNQFCDWNETCVTCQNDCGACNCLNSDCSSLTGRQKCPSVCGGCGDDQCDANENCMSCPQDCGMCSCGNSMDVSPYVCSSDDSYQLCPRACYCGDGTCDAGEKRWNNCPQDCDH